MIPLANKHPAYFQHIMCDIETTGIKPDRNHIIQICAVRFNLKTGEYDPNLFEVCLNPNTASWRNQDPSTMTWWQDPERQPIYDSIIEKSLDSKIAIQAFAHWLGKERLVFWGNRNGFDQGARTVLPALRHLGVDRLDQLLLSHADNDHSGGALAVFSGLPVEQVRSGEASDLPRELRALPCEQDARWSWDGVEFRVWRWPQAEPADGQPIVTASRWPTAAPRPGRLARQSPPARPQPRRSPPKTAAAQFASRTTGSFTGACSGAMSPR